MLSLQSSTKTDPRARGAKLCACAAVVVVPLGHRSAARCSDAAYAPARAEWSFAARALGATTAEAEATEEGGEGRLGGEEHEEGTEATRERRGGSGSAPGVGVAGGGGRRGGPTPAPTYFPSATTPL